MMKLWETRRHWERFAETDPMWAVLTVPGKNGNRWNADEFFATGRQEIEIAMREIRALCPGLRQGHALDFGCGLGRVTQALAGHFKQVTGVDISENMLRLAREHNRTPDRVSFVHNAQPDLACFADASFDLVYSVITLQHVAPEYSRCYLREFLRVLRPGGVALFQVPSQSEVATGGPDERLKFSFWPPTLLKRMRRVGWRKINRRFAFEPVMEMHVVPREDVLAIVREAGGEPLEVRRCDCAGDRFESYSYLIRKR